MVVTLLFLAWVGNSYRSPKVTRRQTLFEGMINYVADLVVRHARQARRAVRPVFHRRCSSSIFVMNQFGLFPFKALGLPFGGSPTADLNTTVPCALMVFFMIQYVAPAQVRHQVLRPSCEAVRVAAADQHARGAGPAGNPGRAPVLQHLRRRTALRHHRVDHQREGDDRPRQPLDRRRDPAVFHSVLQLLRRERFKRSCSPCSASSTSRSRSPRTTSHERYPP